MKTVSILFRFLALSLLLAVGFSVAPEAEARRQNLRLTTLAPKDSSFDKSLKRMGQEWRKATRNQVNLIVFAGGVQGGETAMIDRMRVNQTQAALITGVGLAEIDPAVAGLQQIPMMFHTLDELAHVVETLSPMLEKRIRDKGFVVLTWIDTGWVRIFSKQLLETPADMERGKLFTWAGDTKQTDLLKRLGFRPVPIDSTDITSSLQTGLIDIVPMPPFYALASQSYKSAPHMLDIRYTPLVGAVIVSAPVWDRISPENQAAMKEIARRVGKEMTQAGREENESAIRVMREKFGLKVRESDESVIAAWEKKSEEAYSIIRDTTVPAEIFDEVVRLLAAYRAGE